MLAFSRQINLIVQKQYVSPLHQTRFARETNQANQCEFLQ